MEIFRIAGIAVVTVVLTVTLKSFKPELGMQTAIAGGIIILGYAVSVFSGIAGEIKMIVERSGIDSEIIAAVFRVAGTAYITQSASDICKDAGENGLSSKVEICGRLLMASAMLPMVVRVFGTILNIVGEYL